MSDSEGHQLSLPTSGRSLWQGLFTRSLKRRVEEHHYAISDAQKRVGQLEEQLHIKSGNVSDVQTQLEALEIRLTEVALQSAQNEASNSSLIQKGEDEHKRFVEMTQAQLAEMEKETCQNGHSLRDLQGRTEMEFDNLGTQVAELANTKADIADMRQMDVALRKSLQELARQVTFIQMALVDQDGLDPEDLGLEAQPSVASDKLHDSGTLSPLAEADPIASQPQELGAPHSVLQKLNDLDRPVSPDSNHGQRQGGNQGHNKLHSARKKQAERLFDLELNLGRLQTQVTCVVQALQSKADESSMLEMDTVMGQIRNQVHSMEEEVHNKAGTVDLKQLNGDLCGVQSQVVGLTKTLREKGDADEALKTVLTSVESTQKEVATIKELVREKVGTKQFQTLLESIGMVRTQMSSVERLVQSKAETQFMNDLGGTVSQLERKLTGIECQTAEIATKQEAAEEEIARVAHSKKSGSLLARATTSPVRKKG